MRSWIWVAFCVALLLLLWLIPHTKLVPAVTSYLTIPAPPANPKTPDVPRDSDYAYVNFGTTGNLYGTTTAGGNSNSSGTVFELTRPPGSLPCSDVQVKLISGQQEIETKKQEAEAADKRIRLYVQAGLTLLLAAVCLYILNKKSTPTQRAAATGILGIALGYWFK